MEGMKKSFLSLGDYLTHEKDLESREVQGRAAAEEPGVSSENMSGLTDDVVPPRRFYTDRTATEIECTKMIVCFEKDICIDEGANMNKCCEKDLEKSDDDDRKKQVYMIDDEIPGFDSHTSLMKRNEFESEVIFGKIKDSSILDDGEVAVKEGDRNLFLDNTKTSRENSSSSSYSSSDDVDDNNLVGNEIPAASTTDLESDTVVDISKPDNLEEGITTTTVVQQDSSPENTAISSLHRTSSLVHSRQAESFMIGPQCLSERINPGLGQAAYSDSISIRSESSNTSARSFAFPILHSEGHFSPVKMAKADGRHYRNIRGWKLRQLLCCRF